ncbi:precorrin-8X methylmutase [Clostridium cylindrosporum]|uniref:Cobalt-precorrin-8X methylmutase CbiC n=1 Tax=Clostridium cylindrosporum DSM 605 TaxID=1121307 RepID=A0A0J8DC22_CLOCY|nr:precorrin-8X methylmutase [Clostridium cylindrosporum]KMT21849.1 cobalt-precorrin-8X methylmutase CbiC [Clostridium cylindrosporum DSM 605]
MKIEIENILPMDIEKRSFEIITDELGEVKLDPKHEPIIKRAIHTAADFEYVNNLYFSEGAVDKAITAIKNGATIITDTQMVKAGVNKKVVAKFGGEVICFMCDDDVAKEAKERGVTRAIVSMERASKIDRPLIFAIGNAPTALIKLYEMIESGLLKPELVIGVPVGFVNVVESKELIIESNVTSIVARGRKGGSNIAAAICNALLYMASEGERE